MEDEREGRREVASIFHDRSTRIATNLEEMGKARKSFGDFCERRSSIGALLYSNTKDFNLDAELARNSWHQCLNTPAEPLLSQIEGKIQENLATIPVSLDSADAVYEAPREEGEVDQPAVPFGVSDYAFRGSMSGYFFSITRDGFLYLEAVCSLFI